MISPDKGGAVERESPERDRNHASGEDPAARDFRQEYEPLKDNDHASSY